MSNKLFFTYLATSLIIFITLNFYWSNFIASIWCVLAHIFAGTTVYLAAAVYKLESES